MTKKILFGNNISQISKKLEKCFKSLEFSVTRCENDKKVIFEQIANDDYDALIFFAPCVTDKICGFVNDLRKERPDLKVYCLFYFNMENDKVDVFDIGASKCFTTSSNVNNVCFEIIKDLFDEDSAFFSIEIAEFLVKLGFPCHIKSFYIVCLSIEKLLENPENFSNFSKHLYPFIQQKLNTTYCWAERGIRYISKDIHKKEIYFEYYPKDSVLENKALLQALVIEYTKYMKGAAAAKKLRRKLKK